MHFLILKEISIINTKLNCIENNKNKYSIILNIKKNHKLIKHLLY